MRLRQLLLILIVSAVIVAASSAQTVDVLFNFTYFSSTGAFPTDLIRGPNGSFYGTTLLYGAGERVLYTFHGGADGGADGAVPNAGVIADAFGNLFGTTGGGGGIGCGGTGCGTVFELSPPSTAGGPWTEKVLYSFQGAGAGDGGGPGTPLVFDGLGNLYGTTGGGGALSANCPFGGCGTVFELAFDGGAWSETVLYSFQSGTDGFSPQSNLVFDKTGNLYGTTAGGGGTGCGGIGCGTVFELSPPTAQGGAWTENILYAFQAGQDGFIPAGNLAIDARGNLYGITEGDGKCTSCGTVFKLIPPTVSGGAWSKHVLHYFQDNSSDGQTPIAGPALHQGLYGTTDLGGALGQGTVYQLTPGAVGVTETVLYSFGSNVSDVQPFAGVVFDQAGNLYGTTSGGGNLTGTVFQLQPPSQSGGSWTEAVLHTFTGGPDGGGPYGTLLVRGHALYGTTAAGGNSKCGVSVGCGVVFSISIP